MSVDANSFGGFHLFRERANIIDAEDSGYRRLLILPAPSKLRPRLALVKTMPPCGSELRSAL